ncbi:MAG: response regulator transcription factor [Chloroflexi bacterium]|nr:response regulator transcription factor [Chloroflexota bacterium]
MTSVGGINLRVALIDSDYYTEKAIHAYLAWDRRTRALTDYSNLADFWRALEGVEAAEYPDVIILDVNNAGERGDIRQSIQRLVTTVAGAAVVCLSYVDDLDLFYAAAEGGARAFLHKQDVRFHIASAVCIASRLSKDEFLYSAKMDTARRLLNHRRATRPLAIALPRPVQYEGLNTRIRRVIELYAIEGMPAALIANELNLSVHYVRDNIRSAYEALGLRDHSETFLADLSQRERAFMKLTALEAPRR